jgi:zinc transport system ATP-binding protein
MQQSAPLLSLSGIKAGYEGVLALESVHLEIRDGDFIGMIGPNGGGKSTLLRIILGLIKPYAGSISYRGSNNPKSIRIGYLPQQNRIDPSFPVRVIDVVMSGSGRKSERKLRHRAMEKLDIAGISHKAEAMIGDLSGGQMQRVLIARALLTEPELLLLDEPDTFVDSSFEKDLHELLQSLNQHMAILMVSHDAGMISANVKTIACVNRYLHYHASNLISAEDLKSYGCPIDLITHGDMPHRVLHKHSHHD